MGEFLVDGVASLDALTELLGRLHEPTAPRARRYRSAVRPDHGSHFDRRVINVEERNAGVARARAPTPSRTVR